MYITLPFIKRDRKRNSERDKVFAKSCQARRGVGAISNFSKLHPPHASPDLTQQKACNYLWDPKGNYKHIVYRMFPS